MVNLIWEVFDDVQSKWAQMYPEGIDDFFNSPYPDIAKDIGYEN